jgi:uncharacterized protein (UPF0218 family)
MRTAKSAEEAFVHRQRLRRRVVHGEEDLAALFVHF